MPAALGLAAPEAWAVALIKPQVAFFEAFGSEGFAVLERTISVLTASGTLVLADAKRGDIGSTMAAYARSWLSDDSPLRSDAVTVSPYLGFGSLEPALALAKENHRGVFVLAATSNPEGGQVQLASAADGRTVSQTIVDEAAARNVDAHRLGSVGLVVGATLPHAPDLSRLNGPILMPGVGAQGGGPGFRALAPEGRGSGGPAAGVRRRGTGARHALPPVAALLTAGTWGRCQ